MFQNLVAPWGLTAEGTCNIVRPQERLLLPARAVLTEWVGGWGLKKKVLLDARKSLELISSLSVLSHC